MEQLFEAIKLPLLYLMAFFALLAQAGAIREMMIRAAYQAEARILFRGSRYGAARIFAARKRLREDLIRIGQETGADHAALWIIYARRGKVYGSMAVEWKDDLKLIDMRGFGRRIPISEVPELYAAVAAGAPFVYKAPEDPQTIMDGITRRFFASSLIIPYAIAGRPYFAIAADWVSDDISARHASGSMDRRITACKKLAAGIHGYLMFIKKN